ncbi:hypothetical protein [Amphritea pacifica]|uniref:Uncharacterized protein n=1 Tax=Amphritea pacifica TaxID=2811233 RepID=A0ABS2W7B7_9GAMM|nr:hypothetical protein [Amphritea pacifica]MBN0987402.1 hypothetical protein [Amphritea pacifica]MBN1006036.1 hypothetical protein [Amphritea pacifica]
MAIDWKAIADILNAIAWPLVVGISLFAMQKPLSTLVEQIGKRITKLSYGDYAIELSALPEMRSSSVAAFDVRQLTPTKLFDSASHELFKQLAATQDADYAIIDLGEGDKWLSSRLYIFALILGRVSHLKSFVFVETRDGISRCLVGTATPSGIFTSLAKHYPWFESAFIKVYADIAPDPKTSTQPFELAELAVSNSWQLSDLIRKYIEEIQQSAYPPPESENEWVSFGEPVQIWERSRWLNGQMVEELLASGLSTTSLIDSPEYNTQTKVRAILRLTDANYVVLTDKKERFQQLIDRSELLEKLAKTAE